MSMKLGLGLYAHNLTDENFRFARQAGATHIVAHLADYRNFVTGTIQGPETTRIPGPANEPWTLEELKALRASINGAGLELAALENFDPHHWSDVLLDGPRKAEQMAGLKTIIRNMGKAGIPVMGYNFSFAGVYGRSFGPWARGGAESVGYIQELAPPDDEIPLGTIWNMVVDPDAPPGTIGRISQEQLWSRFKWFLDELVPVAEEAGVRLALHPDDPPLEQLRGTARLLWKPELYRKIFDLHPSHANAAEFCQGTISEMVGEMDVYEAIETYTAAKKIAYVHFRNVKGKVPNYYEMFVDDGDVDMIQALRLYHKHGYDGVLIPDHTPGLEC
ncbi:MAG: D-mannonate dehydratase, partial [Proteobacteria bacterium]|nr:D-mannonate dehydratase [Pseudomonadota bacterium]